MRSCLMFLIVGTTCLAQIPQKAAKDTMLLTCRMEEYLLQGSGDRQRHLFPEVRLRYPVFSADTPSGRRAEGVIRTRLIRLLRAEGSGDRLDIDQAARAFLKNYEAHSKENPGGGFWFIRLTTQILHESDRILTLLLEEESFAGGARAASERAYYTFDRRTGHILKLTDLFSDLKAVARLADGWFRRARMIPDTADLRSRGFRFKGGKFALPENVGLTGRSATFYHNPGTAAPEADGGIMVILPMRDIQQYLKVQP